MESIVGGGGTGGDYSRGPGPRRTSTTTGDKERGLADGVAVHSERDEAGGAGIV